MRTLTATIKNDQTATVLEALMHSIADVITVRLSAPEPAIGSVLDKAEPPQTTAAPRKRPTLAELDAFAAADPDISALDGCLENADWSWLPEGKTKDNFTIDDIKEAKMRERYGI
jgi:hypothetical protein